MSNTSDGGTVWILGAGFSRGLNAPLFRELFMGALSTVARRNAVMAVAGRIGHTIDGTVFAFERLTLVLVADEDTRHGPQKAPPGSPDTVSRSRGSGRMRPAPPATRQAARVRPRQSCLSDRSSSAPSC